MTSHMCVNFFLHICHNFQINYSTEKEGHNLKLQTEWSKLVPCVPIVMENHSQLEKKSIQDVEVKMEGWIISIHLDFLRTTTVDFR